MSTPPGFFVCIRENGRDVIYPTHCTNSDWTHDCQISEDKKTIKFFNTCRLELLETKKDGDWAFHDLLDKKLSYDVDISHVKKGQNFAFYSCQLTKGEQYKDAQSTDSRTELDFAECNRIAWHTTYHKRYDRGGGCIMGLGGGHQSFKSDCGKSSHDLFGPGQWIDSNKPFHVEHIHTEDKARIEISQEGRKIWDEAGGDYWRQLLPEFQGKKHTLIISLWEAGWGMLWLDGQLRVYDESHIDRWWASISNICIDDLNHTQVEEVIDRKSCCCPCHAS